MIYEVYCSTCVIGVMQVSVHFCDNQDIIDILCLVLYCTVCCGALLGHLSSIVLCCVLLCCDALYFVVSFCVVSYYEMK